ncbi:Canalicular multispecific organic anion transporter 1 AltName: Full=ATP-binding cassette sub-family C member 2 [Rhizoctonia solani AG-1 IB]|uniref:Rhizoctonia solani AG1-IB WGS project CAOJ00000000 data, isolate 7/3/14, contig 16418 n=1 Tax=Thanatephorus cucumeris (strain AG1-IB / isolate 7/3/14) TaxID=1108050 RepID=M5C1F0_THACB|nr:Canalicular multispecific organic anion transporter 1 AltName: Full=ATP-binding cassette sub-family C member 2 [Rhizoctonia solani AG-1 IB]
MILLLLVPGKVISLINKIQVEWAKKTDARVQFIVESLNIIRTIKLFSWEKRVKGQSEKKRKEELDCYQKRQLMGLFTVNINHAIPLVVMIVTFSSHTLLFKKPLDASSVFSSIAVFDILRTQLRLLLLQIPSSIQSKVSLDRTNDFLTKVGIIGDRL